MIKILIGILFLCSSIVIHAQLNIVSPSKNAVTVNSGKQYITGTTCATCIVKINDTAVKVYKTGVWAYAANLKNGKNSFTIVSINDKKQLTEKVEFELKPAPPIAETPTKTIESVTTEPAGNLMLYPGEYITIKAKAKPGLTLQLHNGYKLKEKTLKGVRGYYEGRYSIKTTEAGQKTNWKLQLIDSNKVIDEKITNPSVTILQPDQTLVATTNQTNTSIYIGMSEDRLGGTKSGFLDSGVKVQVIAQYGKYCKIKLDNITHQYIAADQLDITYTDIIPESITSNITTTGDSAYDYVRVALQERLPYLVKAYSNKLIFDIYGATHNSNWVMQYPEKLATLKNIDVHQLHDNKLQITIPYTSKQLWGYKMYYEGNTLVLAVRRPKAEINIANMTIAVDAGHGGSNDGARGISGRYEKEFTLLIAKEVERLLLAEGASVIMTRKSDISYENQERLNMLRKKMPDFALSIHLNSAGNPLGAKGTSTYYKHDVYHGLSKAIYLQMIKTGLVGWSNIGNFNFYLNSATEFPTALVETLFISHPQDEEKVHDPAFRTQMAEKIVAGIKDWLNTVK